MNWEPLWHNAQWLVKWCNMWIAFGKVQPGDRRGWPLEVCFCKIIHPCFEEVQIEANNLIRRREILYSTVYTSVRSSSLKPVCGSLSQVGNYKYPITLSLGYRCRRQAGPPPIKGGWTGWLLLNAPSSLLVSGSASSPHLRLHHRQYERSLGETQTFGFFVCK